MITMNELIVNGRSTADFSFDVYVTKNAGYNYAKKKSVLFENTYGTGAIKNETNAYPPIEKNIYNPLSLCDTARHAANHFVGFQQWKIDSQ